MPGDEREPLERPTTRGYAVMVVALSLLGLLIACVLISVVIGLIRTYSP